MMIEKFSGMRVIVSRHAEKIETKVRGLADSRRPNSKRPLYRRVTVRTPLMYMVKGMGLIVHPTIEEKLKAMMADQLKKSADEMFKAAFYGWDVAHSHEGANGSFEKGGSDAE